MEATDRLIELATNLNLVETFEVEAPGVEVKERAVRRQHRRREPRKPDPYKFMLCLDFEATCWEKAEQSKWKVQELIEFPAVLVDLNTGNILAEFREYLKPTEFPTLSDFCVHLTGISQATVNSGISIKDCLLKFTIWLKWQIKSFSLVMPKSRPDEPGNVALCTWTEWDSICLSKECARKKIPKPSYLNQWIDARVIFMKQFKFKPTSFNMALETAGLKFEGQPHSGLDDAKNLARLVHKLKKLGARFCITKDNNPHKNVNQPF